MKTSDAAAHSPIDESTSDVSVDEATRSSPGRLSGIAAVLLVAASASVAQSFGRFTFGVLLPAIRSDLGLSNTLAGSLATLNVAAYLLGTLAVAAATARFKLIAVMRAGMLFAVVGLAVAATSPNAAALGAGLFLMGFGGALTWIPSPVVAAGALAPGRRGFAIGILGSGMGLGVVFAGQLAAFIRSSMGDESWRTVYVVQLLIGLVIVFATTLLVGHDQERLSSKAGIGGFGALRRMEGWRPYICGFTAFGLMYLLVVAFLTTKLEEDSGWSSSQASLAFTLLGVAMVFGGPLFITLSTRRGSRMALSLAFALWAGAAAIMVPGWLAPTLAAAAVSGLLFAGLPVLFTLYVVDHTTTDDYAPAFAAATLAFGVAQMVSPQLGGSVADAVGSFTPVFLLSSALAVIGLISALRLPRRAVSDGDEAVVKPLADWRAMNMTFVIAPSSSQSRQPERARVPR